MPRRVSSVNLTGKAYRRKRPLAKRVRAEANIEVDALEAIVAGSRFWRAAWKMNGLGRAARPDRMLLGDSCTVCFIEFKKPGEVPTAAQAGELDALQAMGFKVAACDSVPSAVRFAASVEKRTLWATAMWRDRWDLEHGK